MRKNFNVFSVIHLLVVLLILSVGGLLVLSSYMLPIQNHLIHLLLNYPNFILATGLISVFVGAILFFGFYSMYKTRYYTIKMGTSKVFVEEAIIREYIRGYWLQIFPKDKAPIEVIIHPKQAIEVIATLSEPATSAIFEKVEKELGLLLARKLGYEKEFLLTIRSS